MAMITPDQLRQFETDGYVTVAGLIAVASVTGAVDHVSVDIKPGEFFSFLGPSGCGKTTILRMISGFISPSHGEIKIGGQNMRGIGSLLQVIKLPRVLTRCRIQILRAGADRRRRGSPPGTALRSENRPGDR